jgi:prepilin-type N-terminal cleavage/methylation domain-containing protein
MNRKGFTLIELILVIAILGILAVSALPRFLDISDEAENAARDGVVGAVRAGVAIFHADAIVNNTTPVWPATLDSASDGACAAANVCFDSVLESGVTDDWSKAGFVYTYVPTGDTFTYTPASGMFQ